MHDEAIRFLDSVCDTVEDADKHQMLYYTTDIINSLDRNVLFHVCYARKKGVFTPVLITSKGEVCEINLHNKVVSDDGKTVELPLYAQYNYFNYNGTLFQFNSRLFFDPVHRISTVSNTVFDDIITFKSYNRDDLYNGLTGLLKQYFYTPYTYEYDILACNIILSYLKGALGRVFYIVFIGAPGTGKTTGLLLLSFLQHNGKFGGKGTVASSVRLLHSFGISLCQDEFDKMSNPEKTLMVGVFNSGFNKHGSYTITNTNVKDILRQTVSFHTFGCKSFTCNHLGGFDSSFLDRCYVLTSLKSNRSTLDINQLNKKQLLEFQGFRDKIFVYTLLHWDGIRDTINNMKTGLEKEGVFGRESDKNSIILGIIQHFKGKPYALGVKRFLEEKAPVVQVERPYTMEYIILKAIAEKYKGLDRYSSIVDVENEELYNALLNGFDCLPSDRYAPSNQKPRQILDNLGLTLKKENLGWVGGKGTRLYHVYTEDFVRIVREHGYNDIIKNLPIFIVTPSKQSIPSTNIGCGGLKGSGGFGDKNPCTIFSGTETITDRHAVWAENYIENHNGVPLSYFKQVFREHFSDTVFPDDDVKFLFETVLKHVKQKSGGSKV